MKSPIQDSVNPACSVYYPYITLYYWLLYIPLNYISSLSPDFVVKSPYFSPCFLFFSKNLRFIIDVAVVTLDYVTLGNYIADAERSSLGQLMRSMRVVRAFRLVRLLKMARFDAPRQRGSGWELGCTALNRQIQSGLKNILHISP